MKKLFPIVFGLLLAGCGNAAVHEAPSSAAPLAMAKHNVLRAARAERLVSYTADVKLGVSDIEKAQKEIAAKTKDLGGYVAEENKKRVVVHVPSNDLDNFIEYLGDKVGTIRDKSKSGADVTESHGDTKAELAAAKAARDSYANLLKKADKVEDVLKIEQELERINAKILRLEQQLKRTEKSVELARVVIRLDDSTFLERAATIALPIACSIGFIALLAVLL